VSGGRLDVKARRRSGKVTAASGPWRRAAASDRPGQNGGEAVTSDQRCRGRRARRMVHVGQRGLVGDGFKARHRRGERCHGQ
jgi:hypothetical protein